jgi:hypothetical protein
VDEEAREMEMNEVSQADVTTAMDTPVAEDIPQQETVEVEEKILPQLTNGFNVITVEDMEAVNNACPNLLLLDAIVWDYAGAKEVLERIGESGSAVRYYSDSEPSDDMKKLENAIVDAKDKVSKYIEEHSIRLFASKTIGCKRCNSQLAKEYLKSDACPLCGNDLRSSSTIEGEKKLTAKVAELEKALQDAILFNHISKGKLLWLVYIK